MIIPWRIVGWAAAGALAVSAIAVGIAWYGSNKYDEGYAQAELIAEAAAAKVSEEYRAKEAKQKEESDAKLAKYEAEKAKTAAASDRLAALYNGLRNEHEAYRRRMSDTASNPAGAARTGRAGLDNYQSCRDRYGSMGAEFARVSDRLNGLIEQCKIGR